MIFGHIETKEDANFHTKVRRSMNVKQSDTIELFRCTHRSAEQPVSYGIREPLQRMHYQQEMFWPVHGAVHMYNPCSSNDSLIQWKKIFILTGSYNPILKPPYKHWRCKPGTMPFHRADIPSSLAMVLTVPSKPLYLGKPTSSSIPTFFWSWSLTLAVSRGIVQNYIKPKHKRIIRITLWEVSF